MRQQCEKISSCAKAYQKGLRQGHIQLKDLVGLTDVEIAKALHIAKKMARLGHHNDANSLFSLLVTHDPLNAVLWSEYSLFLESTGKHSDLKEASALVAEGLDLDRKTPFSRERSAETTESELKKWARRKSSPNYK